MYAKWSWKKAIKIENTWDKRLTTTYITHEYFTYSKLKWRQNRQEELRNDVGKSPLTFISIILVIKFSVYFSHLKFSSFFEQLEAS